MALLIVEIAHFLIKIIYKVNIMKNRIVKLKTVKNVCLYNQNAQTSAILFSLLKRTGKNSFSELFYNVKCREYFGDTCVAAHYDRDVPPIYGFRLKDKRMSLDEMIMSVSLPYSSDEGSSYQSFLKGLTILRHTEKLMGIEVKNRSRYYLTNEKVDEGSKIVVVSPNNWCESPLLASVYTFILRLTTYNTNNTKTLRSCMKYIINNYSNGDKQHAEKLYAIDTNLFFSKYKGILGSSPITGMSDILFKEEIKYLLTGDKDNYLTSPHIDFSYIDKGGFICDDVGEWGLNKNHNLHGIQTFLGRLLCFKENSDWLQKDIGVTWAHNFMRISNGI